MGNRTMSMEEQIKKIVIRLEKLEKLVLNPTKRGAEQPKEEKFQGARGGILLLLSKNFFNESKSASITKDELNKHGYHYRIQVVQTALNRLSKSRGPLVTFEDKGKKVYVKRK